MERRIVKRLTESLVLALFLSSTVPIAYAQGRPPVAVDRKAGPPACEEFFDKWEVPGAPAGVIAATGFGREVMAATDCLKKNNVAMACEHWRRLVAIADKLGPP